MISGFDKKGQQEGTGLGAILAIILGVVAVVVIILGFTMGFDQVFGFLKILPDDLTKMSAVCETYSQQQALVLSYCQFNEGRIEGKKGFYNCDFVHGRAVAVLGADKVAWNKLDVCNINVAENYCTSLLGAEGSIERSNYKDTTIVNDKTCSGWGVPKPVA